jgi:hypothetical protein
MVPHPLSRVDRRKWWNVDGLGYLRGKYLTPVQALRLGAKAIRNCFRDQLEAMRQEGIDQMGMASMCFSNGRRDTIFDVRNRDPI